MDVDIKVLCCGADSKFFAVDVDTGLPLPWMWTLDAGVAVDAGAPVRWR